MAKPTIEALETNEWWWRNPEWNSLMNLLSIERTTPFDEKAAFRYELVRRHFRKKRFRGFLSLPGKHITFVEGIFGEPKPYILPSRHSQGRETDHEQGWTPVDSMRQWNLLAHDETLKRNFIGYIHQQRKLQNIPKPKRNTRNIKPIPWEWLALIDLADLKLRSLNDAERHRLSDARKNANIYARLFADSVKSFDQSKPSPMESYEDYWGRICSQSWSKESRSCGKGSGRVRYRIADDTLVAMRRR
jgi:hypothetical protein